MVSMGEYNNLTKVGVDFYGNEFYIDRETYEIYLKKKSNRRIIKKKENLENDYLKIVIHNA
jgi:hypothetical protein